MHYTTLYPNRPQLNEHMEHLNPEYFNYFCLSGDQLFLVRDKQSKLYKIISSGWRPIGYKADKLESYHTLMVCNRYVQAHNAFRKYCNMMLQFSPSLFGEDN